MIENYASTPISKVGRGLGTVITFTDLWRSKRKNPRSEL